MTENLPQPPPIPSPRLTAEDESHLRLLSIFHYIMAGLYGLGIGFVALHFTLMVTFFSFAENQPRSREFIPSPDEPLSETADFPENSNLPGENPRADRDSPSSASHRVTFNEMFPSQLKGIFAALYGFLALVILAALVCNILAARHLARRANHTFTMVVAGLNCFQIPFGTALGVFTIIVLNRPSVRSAYPAPGNGPTR